MTSSLTYVMFWNPVIMFLIVPNYVVYVPKYSINCNNFYKLYKTCKFADRTEFWKNEWDLATTIHFCEVFFVIATPTTMHRERLFLKWYSKDSDLRIMNQSKKCKYKNFFLALDIYTNLIWRKIYQISHELAFRN